MQNYWNNEELVKVLKSGGIAVMPTDTVYGLVGKASIPETVERIYKVRNRNPLKPFIILVSGISELDLFGVKISDTQKEKLAQLSDRAVSFIVDCKNEKFEYLHRGGQSLAFRIPTKDSLKELLVDTGPLVAPSANLSGDPVALNITEARNYFGDTVDMYVDGGEIEGLPSKIIKFSQDGSVTILRE